MSNCGICNKVRHFFGGGPQLDPGNLGFDERPGTFRVGYERTPAPDPGTGYYAYTSLALMEFPPSGPSVTTRKPIIPTSSPMYVGFGVQTVGMPLVAGQIFSAPLFDPNLPGYSSDPIGAQIPVGVAMNIPSSRPDMPNRNVSFNGTTRTRVRPAM